MAKRIIDCFIFFNELDLLELRLKQHDSSVDLFVLCEATKTFRGHNKQLVFEDNKSRFQPYLHKIMHIVVDDMPEGEGMTAEAAAWGREYHQRRQLKRGSEGLEPDDVVIISDCDEIVSERAFDMMRAGRGYFMLDMPMYQFYFNMEASASGWNKVFAYSKDIEGTIEDFSLHRLDPFQHFNRLQDEKVAIGNAGWHFTYLGGAAKVAEKLGAYSHLSGWTTRFEDPRVLQRQMRKLQVVGGDLTLTWVPIDSRMPKALVESAPQLEERGYIKNVDERLRELQGLYHEAEDRIDACARDIAQLSCKTPGVNLLRDSTEGTLDFVGRNRHIRSNQKPGGPFVLQHHSTTQEEPVLRFRRFAPGMTYTCSCLVRGDGRPALEISNFATLRHGAIAEHEGWMRVFVTGTAKAESEYLDIFMRSNRDAAWFSSSWQFEIGDNPSPYNATRSIELLDEPLRTSWFDGVQDDRIPSDSRPNAVKEHRIDKQKLDTNCGFYATTGLLPNTYYEGSCSVMMESEDCEDAFLSIGEWLGQSRHTIDLRQTGVWQRLSVRCKAPREATSANLILRVRAAEPAVVRSKDWRLIEVTAEEY